jgi:hypothetical protein
MLKLISVLCKCIFRSKPPIAKSIEDVKAIVDKAIKDEYPPLIDTIEEQRDLRIAQKYIDQLISNKGLDVSFEAYLIGLFGLIFAIFGIGLAYIILPNQYAGQIIETYAIVGGGIVVFLIRRSIKKIKKEIKFMQCLVLRIEERLEK